MKYTPMEEGWLYAASLSGSGIASQHGQAYVGRVNNAIDQTIKELQNLKSNQTDASLGGFAAENWHAGTFNIKAAAAGSGNKAIAGAPGTDGALGRNNYGSVDVRVQTSKGGVINDYGSKYMVNAKETAKEQARPNIGNNSPKYHGQKRLVPSDQVEDVRGIANSRANNAKTPENWRQGYEETANTATDRIDDGKISSKPLSKEESEELARDIKKGKVSKEKYGLTADEAIEPAYIMKQATKAGLSAAAITALLQATPDLIKAVDYLIKNKAIDAEQFKKAGFSAIKGAADGFIRGFIACTIQIMCNSGKLGPSLINADPLYVGTVVALVLQTIKNSISVAKGEMTIREMGTALIDMVVISSGYIVGAKIGGAIGAALGFEMPVVGFLLGTLIGCAIGAAYDFSKKKLISFCVDSGFTCFGLVEQDYTIPEDALKEMGIDITPIDRTEINRNELSKTQIDNSINRTSYDTVEIKVLRRGIIGVNRIGYVQ